jgi:hypothetical protein
MSIVNEAISILGVKSIAEYANEVNRLSNLPFDPRSLITDSMIRRECMKAQVPLDRINQILLVVTNEDRALSLDDFCAKWVK